MNLKSELSEISQKQTNLLEEIELLKAENQAQKALLLKYEAAKK